MKYLTMSVASCLLLYSAMSFADDQDTKQSSGVSSVSSVRGTDLHALIRDVGARTHKQFILDPRVPLSVDLGGLDAKELSYPQLLAVLGVNGFVVVPDEGLLQVVPDSSARSQPSPIVAPDNIKSLDDEWVTCVVALRNVSASQLVPILRPLMPANGQMASINDRNALILSDRAANVRRLVELIGIIEKLPKVTADLPAQKAP